MSSCNVIVQVGLMQELLITVVTLEKDNLLLFALPRILPLLEGGELREVIRDLLREFLRTQDTSHEQQEVDRHEVHPGARDGELRQRLPEEFLVLLNEGQQDLQLLAGFLLLPRLCGPEV